DYTNRGRIITPLKDRYGSLIRTHYPKHSDDEVQIMEQEMTSFPDMDSKVLVPQYMKEIIAEITALARHSGEINQRSGVSVRVSIANYESIISSAFKRGLRNKEDVVAPRISDLSAIVPSTMGKIELETLEDGREGKVMEELTKKAVLNVFGHYFGNTQDLESVVLRFDEGLVVEAGTERPSSNYVEVLRDEEVLDAPVKKLETDKTPALVASAVEFLLEGLHLKRRLNKDRVEGTYRYRS
ncbi:MAG: magnesium chelatase, partial [Chloroflexi bacterium]|nr:magnesium chelatase [Chloroflexota bacterium]